MPQINFVGSFIGFGQQAELAEQTEGKTTSDNTIFPSELYYKKIYHETFSN